MKCNDTTNGEYTLLMNNGPASADPWHCLNCVIKENHVNMPFTLCNDTDLKNLNIAESMRILECLPNFEVQFEISKFSNLSSYDKYVNLKVNYKLIIFLLRSYIK